MASMIELDSAWKPVKIGAGGWITGIDVAPDGTMVARTDTYGAYLWKDGAWTQLVTAGSMPAGLNFSSGVYEIRVSASNSNVLYMEMGDGIYKSSDKGNHWTKTSFPVTVSDPNGGNRMDGQKMAIDPNNSDVVFAGTQKDGLWVTRDGGAHWDKISAVPQGLNTNDPGLTGISIKGSTVYVGTAGSGVYASNDGGVSWRAIGGPADVSHAAISADGSYYATDNSVGALWKYANNSWTKVLNDNAHAVAVDPFNPNHIVVTTEGGTMNQSKDGGATWGGWNWTSSLESSNDIPWLEDSGNYMSSGGLVFDPLVQGKLWQSAGVGVWETSVPQTLNWNTPTVWNSHSKGIEQLVTNEILAPVGGNPVFASWDRAFFEQGNLDEYATNYSGGEFSMGWSIDYASNKPSFMVGISDWWGSENSGFSVDGGKTWEKFTGLPDFALNTVGGSIAASTDKNFVWVASGNQPPAYTLDGGKTWQSVNIPEVTDWSAAHHAYYLSKTTITADRVQPNTFYLYDVGSGVYRTTDGGVNWTKMHSGQISDWSYWNSKIEAVPGSPGELYFTSGPQGNDANAIPGMINFKHSKDGGATWQDVPGVQTTVFGYGAPKVEGGPATVFIVGSVNGKYGVWYSDDASKTWTQIGDHPMGSLDGIKAISGDMDTYGRVYIGFGGSGFAYLDINNAPVMNPVTGTDGNDTLWGTAGTDKMIGLAGNDIFYGSAGADTIDGGLGTDIVSYFASKEAVNIDLGRALQIGGDAEGDSLSGIERVAGSKFNDVLTGNAASNNLDGNAGDDVLNGKSGADNLRGGAGNDTFVFDSAAEANGDFIVDWEIGDKIDISAIDANTLLAGNQAFKVIDAKAFGKVAGEMRITNDGVNTYLSGDTNGDGKADFTIKVAGVHTKLAGINGSATPTIEWVNTTGTAGKDVINGTKGNDKINALGGNDVIYGSLGADQIDGGAGSDAVSYVGSNAAVKVDLAQLVQAGGHAEGDILTGIERLVGSAFNDVLRGDSGANSLNGNRGDDILEGRGGADTLTGGEGNNTFVFNSASDANGDVITDWSNGDKIDLRGIDANSKVAGDQGFVFVGANAFDGTAGSLRATSDGANTYVSGDTNGDGVADFTITLAGVHALNPDSGWLIG